MGEDEIQGVIDILARSLKTGCLTTLDYLTLIDIHGSTQQLSHPSIDELSPEDFDELSGGRASFSVSLGAWDQPRVSLNMASTGVEVEFEEFESALPALKTRVTNILRETIVPSNTTERALEEQPPAKSSDTIFLGHGGDNKWRAVEELLKHEGYNVEAFESEDRTGYATLDRVIKMIESSRIAVLVMTGVDELKDPGRKLLARPNVVHEIGLAQGILGPVNTIIILEDGTEEFTNIAGLTQVRAEKGNLHSAKAALLTAVASRFKK